MSPTTELQTEVLLTLDEFLALKATTSGSATSSSSKPISAKIHFTFADEDSAIKFLNGYKIYKVDLFEEIYFDTPEFDNIKADRWIKHIVRPGQETENITTKLFNKIQCETSHSAHLIYSRDTKPVTSDLKEFTRFDVARVQLIPKEITNKHMKETLTLDLASFKTGDHHNVFCLTFTTSLEVLEECLRERKEEQVPNETNAHPSRSKIIENLYRLGKLKTNFSQLYDTLRTNGKVLPDSKYCSYSWLVLSLVEHFAEREPRAYDPEREKRVLQLSEEQKTPLLNRGGVDAFDFQDSVHLVYAQQYPPNSAEEDEEENAEKQDSNIETGSEEAEKSRKVPVIYDAVPVKELFEMQSEDMIVLCFDDSFSLVKTSKHLLRSPVICIKGELPVPEVEHFVQVLQQHLNPVYDNASEAFNRAVEETDNDHMRLVLPNK